MKVEVYNEVGIYTSCTLYIAFTDLVQSPSVKKYSAYLAISVIGLIVLVNIVVMGVHWFSFLKHKLAQLSHPLVKLHPTPLPKKKCIPSSTPRTLEKAKSSDLLAL